MTSEVFLAVAASFLAAGALLAALAAALRRNRPTECDVRIARALEAIEAHLGQLAARPPRRTTPTRPAIADPDESPAAEEPADDNSPPEDIRDEPGAYCPAPPGAEPLRQAVLRLAAGGRSAEQIARRLDLPLGEIELILRLEAHSRR